MRGTSTLHSPAQHLVAVMAAAATLISIFMVGDPAGAHEIKRVYKERRHIKNRARAAIGAPYRYGGTSKRGFDCSGFSSWVFEGHGANLPRSSADQWRLRKRNSHKRIRKRKNLHRGDLVFHKTTSARVGHVGVYVGRGKFISTTSSRGVRVNSIRDPYYWGPRWVGGVRVPATQRH